MATLAKISAAGASHKSEVTYPNVWARHDSDDFSRLVVGSRSNEIRLTLDLCKSLPGPFWVLFILTVSRRKNPCARYQSAAPVDHDALEEFLTTYQDFFEQDARQELWVCCATTENQFVFDPNNLIYAYGDLDRHAQELKRLGYGEGSIVTPAPHTHHYHANFDADEDAVLSHWKWLNFKMRATDA